VITLSGFHFTTAKELLLNFFTEYFRSSTDEEQEPKTPINPVSLPAQPPDPKLTVNVVKVQTAPLGKPPKYPSFKNRTIGPDIEERIRELSARKPGVKFINILPEPFLYESVLPSFSLVTVWLCNFFCTRKLVQNLLLKC